MSTVLKRNPEIIIEYQLAKHRGLPLEERVTFFRVGKEIMDPIARKELAELRKLITQEGNSRPGPQILDMLRTLDDRITDLQNQVNTLKEKRGPGRPKKQLV